MIRVIKLKLPYLAVDMEVNEDESSKKGGGVERQIFMEQDAL